MQQDFLCLCITGILLHSTFTIYKCLILVMYHYFMHSFFNTPAILYSSTGRLLPTSCNCFCLSSWCTQHVYTLVSWYQYQVPGRVILPGTKICKYCVYITRETTGTVLGSSTVHEFVFAIHFYQFCAPKHTYR